jgi:hypothetical protein
VIEHKNYYSLKIENQKQIKNYTDIKQLKYLLNMDNPKISVCFFLDGTLVHYQYQLFNTCIYRECYFLITNKAKPLTPTI